MHIVTAEEMRRLDFHTIDRIGIPAVVLMENAGREIAREVMQLAETQDRAGRQNRGAETERKADVRSASGSHGELKSGRKAVDDIVDDPVFAFSSRQQTSGRWLILVGKGNNGGDGLAAARHLADAGCEPTIVYAVPSNALAGDAAFQRDVAARLGLNTIVYGDKAIDWQAYDGIVDALLGTGTAGPPREPYASLIREANASGLPIVAADIPSGLDADTGAVFDPCIRASRTVALAFLKRGLVQFPGAQFAGQVVVRPIGIPARLVDDFAIRTFLLHERLLTERLKLQPDLPRQTDSHKGTYGHVLVAAGSRSMSGAGLLCAKAALRAGCGLVTWAVPDRLVEPLLGRLPEAMLAGLPDGGRGDWSAVPADELLTLAAERDALALGPGLGRWQQGGAWLREVWEGAACPLVLDADALNLLAEAGDYAAWRRRGRDAATVLTPHPGEMARLAGVPVREVQRDRIGLARRYALQHEVTLVLKGARTVVATPEGVVYVNTTGNAGMATGGAGDVLTGVIAGLLAQGYTAEQAAALGVYLHGAAGDRAAAKRNTVSSLIAGDILEQL